VNRVNSTGEGVPRARRRIVTPGMLMIALASTLALQVRLASQTVTRAQDPGVRAGAAGAGGALNGLTTGQQEYFLAGQADFAESESVDDGLGPRMNLDSCGGCHSQPALGGSSPAVNPQFAFATANGASDSVPSFITERGPVREARFVTNPDGSADGGVHALFTIAGRAGGAAACKLTQPDFDAQLSRHNVIFRIPTPTYGAGLIEQIPDGAILANQSSGGPQKQALGIRGRANFTVAGRTITGQTNNNGNDGTIARFGWKAQNKSLLIFSGEAYNVEMGITNDLFPSERDEDAKCQFAMRPNSIVNSEAVTAVDALSSIEKFSLFMRFLAAPAPSTTTPGGSASIGRGKQLFASTGCVFCHTPSFTTAKSAVPALSEQVVNLYSDLLVHDMGSGLADGITQGEAGPREFRTAPLWGLGQRVFFLHDGRSSDLIEAIGAHASDGSEATAVVSNFMSLTEAQKQDLLNFLRSL
jgi:CxxC motif-containing protein (DUF1111 family)